MWKIFLAILLLGTLVTVTGCQQHAGSREYVPSKGWVPND